MKTLSLAGLLASAMSLPSAALAKSDCNLDMKDMLQGTLDMAKQSEVNETDEERSHGCTLASGQQWLAHIDAPNESSLPESLFVTTNQGRSS